jgi:hypothetical protein
MNVIAFRLSALKVAREQMPALLYGVGRDPTALIQASGAGGHPHCIPLHVISFAEEMYLRFAWLDIDNPRNSRNRQDGDERWSLFEPKEPTARADARNLGSGSARSCPLHGSSGGAIFIEWYTSSQTPAQFGRPMGTGAEWGRAVHSGRDHPIGSYRVKVKWFAVGNRLDRRPLTHIGANDNNPQERFDASPTKRVPIVKTPAARNVLVTFRAAAGIKQTVEQFSTISI